MQPSVVPTISSASPISRTPPPRAHAGKSKGPELIGVPAGSPSSSEPGSESAAWGIGTVIGASRPRRWDSPIASRASSL
jgi:hypothetical protein